MRVNKKGSINIIVTIIFSSLIGLGALVIDAGMSYYEVGNLQSSLDIAALAGALELPSDDTEATNKALEYMALNFPEGKNLYISITNQNKEIEIYGAVTVNYRFSKIFGVQEKTFSRRSKVIIAPLVSAYSGIRPFVVESQTLEYGQDVILKSGSGGSNQGNFGAVALGGSGACVLRHNVLYGYDGTLSIGDEITTEPGNMASIINPLKNYLSNDNSTFDNFERTSKRLWVVPIVDSLDVNGRSEVTVVGFAQFFIENVKKQSGKTNITGRFIKYVNSGEIDVTGVDNGIYGSKLVD